MRNSHFLRYVIIMSALLVALAPVRADELQSLPPATNDTQIKQEAPARTGPSDKISAPSAMAPVSQIMRIASDVPAYIERGVVMVPLRPLAQFLGFRIRNLLGVVVVESSDANSAFGGTRLMLRNGSAKAQIEKNGVARVLALPLAMQTRLGNAFVPARVISAVFGATAQAVPEENGIILSNSAGRKGLFSSIAHNGYRGDDAARVVIENNVGRALSLHLSGPQDVRIELGSRARITRNLRPGVYNFRAAANGMKTRNGVRHFVAKQRATWNWGRK